MSNFNNRIIDARTHGRSRTYLVRTQRGESTPEPIRCVSSFIRSLFFPRIHGDDVTDYGLFRVKYSRNNGPVTTVNMPNSGSYEAWRLGLIQLDTDLSRGSDGESVAFFMSTDYSVEREPTIVEFYDTSIPWTPQYENPGTPVYLTGIDSNGIISNSDLFITDARDIAIVQPEANQGDWNEFDTIRWYPTNTIVKEANTLTLYPVDNMGPTDIDLYEMLGGTTGEPLVITSCAVAVPNKYECLATSTRISQGNVLSSTRMISDGIPEITNLSARGVGTLTQFDDNPFPFNYGDNETWPPFSEGEFYFRGREFVCTFSKNGSPPKSIVWTTGADQHLSTWEAIKALILDDEGRTAFVLSDFNTGIQDWSGNRAKSGIGSSALYDIMSDNDNIRTERFVGTGGATEVRDSKIRFSSYPDGLVWKENTITIYPTPESVRRSWPLDGDIDYYHYLCNTEEQYEAGQPIVIHSCSAVEPKDLVRVDTSLEFVENTLPLMESVSLSIKINDGPVQDLLFPTTKFKVGGFDALKFISLLGADPVYIPEFIDRELNEPVSKSKTNLMYFKYYKKLYLDNISFAGCSGLETPMDEVMPFLHNQGYDFDNETVNETVLVIPSDLTDMPIEKVSNKVTIYRKAVSGYTDFFTLLDGTTGNSVEIYSAAAVPVVIMNPDNNGDIEPTDPIEPTDYTPLVFSTTTEVDAPTALNLRMSLVNTTDDWTLFDDETNDVIASRNTLSAFTGETTTLSLNTPNMTYRKYRLEGEVNDFQLRTADTMRHNGSVMVESFSDLISEYMYNVPETVLTVPTQLPEHITNLDNMFENCTVFDQDISGWDTSRVTSMKETFKGCSSFNQDISGWDVSKVTTMEAAFNGCTAFNQDISGWNTASLTDLSHTFVGCSNFNSPLNDWDVSKVTRLDNTFGAAVSFDQPLNNWDVGMVYTIRECFSGASDFNQDIGDWNVERVEDMQYAFNGAIRFNQDLSRWNTASLINLEGTFKGARKFNSNIGSWNTSQVAIISSTFEAAWAFNQPLNDWDVSNVSTMQSTFSGATAFNQPLNNWDVSNVGGSFPMYGMFEGASAFNQDLSSWCVPNVNYINKFDEGAASWSEPRPPWGYCGLEVVSSLQFTITTGDTVSENERWEIGFPEGLQGTFKILKDGVPTNTSGDVIDSDIINQYGAIAIYVPPNTTRTFALQASVPVVHFSYYTDIRQSTNQIAIDTFSDNILRYEFAIQNAELTVPQVLPDHITNMFAMFKNSNKFNQDLSGWDVSRITNTTDAFKDCVMFNGDVTTWSLNKLTNATRMFSGCTVFNQPIGNWNTPVLSIAKEMFFACTSFNQDLNNWNVSTVNNFEGMFYNARVFNGNIVNWNMKNAAVLLNMFYNARAFNQPIGNWNVSKVSNFDGMFSYAVSFNQDISTWNMTGVKNVNGLSNMFAQAIGFNQDLSTWNVLKVPSRPYEFDSGLTATWTLPRPKWGTDGVVTVPTVPMDASDLNIDVIIANKQASQRDAGVTFKMSAESTDWVVYLNGVEHANATDDYNPSVNIKNSDATISIKGNIVGLEVIVDTDTEIGMTLDVLDLSQSINGYKFNLRNAALKLPAVLPPCVNTTAYMLQNTKLDSDISGWDMSNVTDTSWMLMTNETFNQDISGWDMSSVVNMEGMFYSVHSFNQDISTWNVTNVTNMGYMFYDAVAFNQDLSGWDVTNIATVPDEFATNATSWTLPTPVWGTSGGGEVIEYDDTTALKFTVTAPVDNEGLSIIMYGTSPDWVLLRDGVVVGGAKQGNGTSITFANKVTTVNEYALIGSNDTTILVKNDWTSQTESINVTQFPTIGTSVKFNGLEDISLTVPEILPANLTDLSGMFTNSYNFNTDIGGWDTSHVVTMKEMFKTCKGFNRNLNYWDVSNVTDMSGMFEAAVIYNQPMENWNVSAVTTLSDMFRSARKFNQDISGWDVSNVYNMGMMFSTASEFNQDLSTWNVINIPEQPDLFDSMANEWVLPRPIWGTSGGGLVVPEITNFSFEVDNTMNADVRTFEFNLHSSNTCNISRNGTDIYVSSPIGDMEEISESNAWPARTIYITVPAGVKYTYVVSAPNIQKMVMSVNAYNNLAAKINVLSFSPDIPHYQFNVEGWPLDVQCELLPNITSAYMMFYNAREFNSDISTWDVSNITNMEYMFAGALLFNQDLSSWKVVQHAEEPAGFKRDVTNWTLPTPIWGTSGM